RRELRPPTQTAEPNLKRPLARRRRGYLAEATPDGGGRPNHAGSYHTHPRSIRAIDQRVRTDFVLDIRDVDLRRRQPLQRLGYIAGPDAPSGTVSEFHHMAPIVLFDLHRRSPCDRSEPWMSQRRREAGPPARLLERLSCRGTDALTNFFANLGICATSRIESYS